MGIETIKENIKLKLIGIHNKYCSEKINPNLKMIDLFEFCNTDDAVLSNKLAPFVRIATRFEGITEAMQGESEDEIINEYEELNKELKLALDAFEKLNNKEV